MAIRLYMDHNVPRAITNSLRLKGIDIVTAYEDGSSQLDDSQLLDRSSELGRVLITRDFNLLQEATKRQRDGKHLDPVSFHRRADIFQELFPLPGKRMFEGV